MANAISLALEIFGLAAAISLLASFTLAWLGSRLTPLGRGDPLVLPCAVSLGFFAGYAELPRDWASLIPQPDQPWQWLPYCGVVAAILAALVASQTKSQAWNLAVLVAAPITASFLTPGWPVLGMGQRALWCVLVIYLLAISAPLLFLPARLPNKASAALL